MKHIIHNYDVDRSLTILKNCHRGMLEKNKLLETLIPSDNQPQKWLDLAVFLMTSSREPPETEYENFSLTKVNRIQNYL